MTQEKPNNAYKSSFVCLDDQAPGYKDLEKLSFFASLSICLIEWDDFALIRVKQTAMVKTSKRQHARRGPCLVPISHTFMPDAALADSCEPELPLRIIFGRDCSTAQVPSWPVAPTQIQGLRQLAG